MPLNSSRIGLRAGGLAERPNDTLCWAWCSPACARADAAICASDVARLAEIVQRNIASQAAYAEIGGVTVTIQTWGLSSPANPSCQLLGTRLRIGHE